MTLVVCIILAALVFACVAILFCIKPEDTAPRAPEFRDQNPRTQEMPAIPPVPPIHPLDEGRSQPGGGW